MAKYKRSEIYGMRIPNKYWDEFTNLAAEAERRGDVEPDCEHADEKRARLLGEAYDNGRFGELIARCKEAQMRAVFDRFNKNEA